MIIGATGGIGRACARDLRRRGYELVVNGRRAEPLEQLAGELGAETVIGDCADPDVAGRLADGDRPIELLLHAAGILTGSELRDQPVDEFDAVIRANLRSAYLAIQSCLPRMGAGGRIILISSSSATRPMRGLTAYSAAKAGLNALAGALAGELESEGINVNLVSPAPVDTPMMDQSSNAFAMLRPEDVAGVVGWLTTLPPHVIVRDIAMRAASTGPFTVRVSAGTGSAGIPVTWQQKG